MNRRTIAAALRRMSEEEKERLRQQFEARKAFYPVRRPDLFQLVEKKLAKGT